MIHLLRSRASPEQLNEMLEAWELTVKLAVDINRQVIAGGGKTHTDCEDVLIADGSQQQDIWGASYLPEIKRILYDSVINIRPNQMNYSNEIQDPAIREGIAHLIQQFLEDI